jgi:hypothetical protein
MIWEFFYLCKTMAFSFKVQQLDGLEEELSYLIRKYKIGPATIRREMKRDKGRCNVYYYVDVHELTDEGILLKDWLRRGKQYDQERKKDPSWMPCLCGPVWVTETSDGFILRRWQLKEMTK